MKFKNLLGAGLAAGALTVLSIGGAGAAVTFDPATGTGFVGKGDVQLPFGWNDSKLQQYAEGVNFSYSATSNDAYEVTCEWDTGRRTIVHHIQTKTANVASVVTYDLTKTDRKNPNGKVTGFNLTGKGTETVDETGSVPAVGGECPENEGNGVEKFITNVELLSSTSTESLTAYHLGQEKTAVIWPPPPAI